MSKTPNLWIEVYHKFFLDARENFWYTVAMEKPSISQQPKKRGPLKRGYGNVHILLPPDLIDWAKAQPEGLSGVARRLFTEERRRQARNAPPA